MLLIYLLGDGGEVTSTNKLLMFWGFCCYFYLASCLGEVPGEAAYFFVNIKYNMEDKK